MTGAQPPRMTRANPAGSWRIMSGVATSWRVAWSWPRIFHDAWPQSLAAVFTPAAGQLSLAVHDGDHLDALAAGVRQPGRQRDRADLRHLVQAHQQRRIQPAGEGGLAGLC